MEIADQWLALMQAVQSTLQEASLWQKKAHLLVGVSGGVDSMALLMALIRCRAQGEYQLTACHINHGLRDASAEEQQFVKRFCEAQQIPCHVLTLENMGTMQDAGIETRARVARRAAFQSLMETHQMDAVCLAHHLDDQAETVLMHLLRGAGSGGLSGMQRVSAFGTQKVMRPFLTLRKQQLIEAVHAESLPYREDESNAWLCTPRNTLRHTILPSLDSIYPSACVHIAQASAHVRLDEDCLQQQAKSLFDDVLFSPKIVAVQKEPLKKAHQAITQRVLRLFYAYALDCLHIEPDEKSLSAKDTDALFAMLSKPSGHKINLPCNLQASVGKDHLHLRMQNGDPILPIESIKAQRIEHQARTYVLGDVIIEASIVTKNTISTSQRVIVSPRWIDQGLVLRHPMAGDVLHGYQNQQKPLRRLLIDAKIDLPFRAFVPVLAYQNEVLWVPDLFVSKALRLPQMDGILLQIPSYTS